MLHRFTILAAAGALLFIPGCSKPSEAELAEKERVEIRAKKRENAAKYYRALAEKFPNSPHAKEAEAKAAELEKK